MFLATNQTNKHRLVKSKNSISAWKPFCITWERISQWGPRKDGDDSGQTTTISRVYGSYNL
jgi:hypothetical protein